MGCVNVTCMNHLLSQKHKHDETNGTSILMLRELPSRTLGPSFRSPGDSGPDHRVAGPSRGQWYNV